MKIVFKNLLKIVIIVVGCMMSVMLVHILANIGLSMLNLFNLSQFSKEFSFLFWMILSIYPSVLIPLTICKWFTEEDKQYIKLKEEKTIFFEKEANHQTDFIFTTKNVKGLEVSK